MKYNILIMILLVPTLLYGNGHHTPPPPPTSIITSQLESAGGPTIASELSEVEKLLEENKTLKKVITDLVDENSVLRKDVESMIGISLKINDDNNKLLQAYEKLKEDSNSTIQLMSKEYETLFEMTANPGSPFRGWLWVSEHYDPDPRVVTAEELGWVYVTPESMPYFFSVKYGWGYYTINSINPRLVYWWDLNKWWKVDGT